MQVVIGGKRIELVDTDVKVAKRVLKNFLEVSKTEAEEKGAATFYYTLLCVMYVMSHDLIQSLTPEVLAFILNARAKNEESLSN